MSCEVQETMPRRRPIRSRDRKVCMRCSDARSFYVFREITFCDPCFQKHIFTRVIRHLHPSLLVDAKSHTPRPRPQGSDVVLGLSGGAGSTVLLDLLTTRGYVGNGQERDIKKGQKPAVWEQGWAVYVDFGSVLGEDNEQGERLRRMADERRWRFVKVAAEDAFDPGFGRLLAAQLGLEAGEEGRLVDVDLSAAGLPMAKLEDEASPIDHLRALLTSLPPASRPTILQHILDALLLSVAQMIPTVSHLLLGETSTREAQRVIASTAGGRGFALPLELAGARDLPSTPSSSSSAKKITRIKPLKEISVKEAAFYCRSLHLETFNFRRWDSGPTGRGKEVGSIEALTERFIASLSTSHPATVTAITKTANKLRFTGDENGKLCPLCQAPVDPSAEEWKARATLTSLPGRGRAAAGAGEPSDPLAPLLCYACLTSMSGGKRTAPLPLWVSERAQPRVISQDEMRASIADHLL